MQTEKYSAIRSTLTAQARSLCELAQAFHRTGNTAVADQLWTIAESIGTSSDDLHKIVGEDLAKMCSSIRELGDTIHLTTFALAKSGGPIDG